MKIIFVLWFFLCQMRILGDSSGSRGCSRIPEPDVNTGIPRPKYHSLDRVL